MDTLTEVDVLIVICQRLELAGIPYMLTGSLASSLYLAPRMTRDIDIVIELNPSSVPSLTQVFQHDCYVSEDAILEAIKYERSFNVIYQPASYKIDFMIRKNASYRKIEFQRRRQIEIQKTLIWIVSPEDLIISKLHWAKDSLSEMQLKDVQNLLNCQKLDEKYMHEWIKKLDLEKLYNMAKKL
ncbi:MAG: hypothetical protein KDK56_10140 [Simkania sp.]|nr:hypothetical protein [Simkania sp.]MCB1075691.1 hypothetical protein [Simkania sp.]MCP5489682.1 hypothetical protein [Chlamydiales bacterium]